MGVTIYTKPGCPYCAAAKTRLQEQNVAYEEIDVYLVEGAREKLLGLTGGRAVVPVIVDGEKVSVAPGGG
jgi:glutaredoxin 3